MNYLLNFKKLSYTKMKSIKINHIESASLSKAEMAHTKGGNVCNCSCYYRNVGGSSFLCAVKDYV